jgi:hypothetical protein
VRQGRVRALLACPLHADAVGRTGHGLPLVDGLDEVADSVERDRLVTVLAARASMPGRTIDSYLLLADRGGRARARFESQPFGEKRRSSSPTMVEHKDSRTGSCDRSRGSSGSASDILCPNRTQLKIILVRFESSGFPSWICLTSRESHVKLGRRFRKPPKVRREGRG